MWGTMCLAITAPQSTCCLPAALLKVKALDATQWYAATPGLYASGLAGGTILPGGWEAALASLASGLKASGDSSSALAPDTGSSPQLLAPAKSLEAAHMHLSHLVLLLHLLVHLLPHLLLLLLLLPLVLALRLLPRVPEAELLVKQQPWRILPRCAQTPADCCRPGTQH